MDRAHAVGGLLVGLLSLVVAVAIAVAMTAEGASPGSTSRTPPVRYFAAPTPSASPPARRERRTADPRDRIATRPSTESVGPSRNESASRAAPEIGQPSGLRPQPSAARRAPSGASQGYDDDRGEDHGGDDGDRYEASGEEDRVSGGHDSDDEGDDD